MVSAGLGSIGGRCGSVSKTWVVLSASTSHVERQISSNRGVLSQHYVTPFESWFVKTVAKTENVECPTEDAEVKTVSLC